VALSDGVVVLRDVRQDDVPALVEGCRDPLTRRFTAAIPDPYEEEDARRWVALQPSLIAGGRERHFAIAGAQDDALLGMTGVHHVDRAARSALCGYWVGPHHRGRGVAGRALRLLVRWALDDYGVVRLGLFADVENVASQRVAEAAGFTVVGPARHLIGGREREAVEYALGGGARSMII
jgi:RimJ/RimL family protein N-acetyltransferase